MSKDNFESIISELMKGPANIESVNFHFGDCNSTTYMGGEVEEEYEEEYGCDDCGCGCCPADLPVVDNDVVAEWVQKKTGIDLATIEKVLEAEEEYLEEIGVAIPVDGGKGTDDEPDGEGGAEQDSKPAKEDKPEQPSEPEQESAGRSKEDELDAMFEGLFPGILGMGLMGALLCDILGSAKKKEDKDGKNE